MRTFIVSSDGKPEDTIIGSAFTNKADAARKFIAKCMEGSKPPHG